MLFLDGVYIDGAKGADQSRWVKVPTSAELDQLVYTIARRVGRFLERQGLLERDAENIYLTGDTVDEDPMAKLFGHSITYRIDFGPQPGRKVFTLQTILDWEDDDRFARVVKESGFSLHAGVAAQAWERQKLERLC